MNTFSRQLCLIPILLLGTVAVAVADARTQDYRDVPLQAFHRTVSLRGLDLSSERDMKRLHFRLYLAARSACDGRRSYPRGYITDVLRPCMKGALDRAVAQIQSPALTAYHALKSQSLRLSQAEATP